MDSSQSDIFSTGEIDTLQELMNIAFGQAAADLAEVINIFIVLSTPKLKIIKATDLLGYLQDEIPDFSLSNIVEQSYWGKAKGVALLVFPYGAEKELLAFFKKEHEQEAIQSDGIDDLEKEILMEVGNILIGACVGKMSELTKDMVTYLPPRVIRGDGFQSSFLQGMFDPDTWAIILKTVFQFEDHDVSGYLFLINSNESLDYLRNALKQFWKQFE